MAQALGAWKRDQRQSCVFAELAEADLLDIALFIATDSPARALSFVAELRNHCDKITNNPKLYRLREEYGSGVRVAPRGQNPIFYCETPVGVLIERILHGARHLDWVQV